MWARNGQWILHEMPDFHVAFRNLLHAVNLRHGTDSFTSPPEEGVMRIFSPWKIRRLRPGLNPANLGTKGQHATSRPPKPLFVMLLAALSSLLCTSTLLNMLTTVLCPVGNGVMHRERSSSYAFSLKYYPFSLSSSNSCLLLLPCLSVPSIFLPPFVQLKEFKNNITIEIV